VPAFGEFLDHLPVKYWGVVGLSAENQATKRRRLLDVVAKRFPL
jgi:hypothetical protein